MKGFVIALVAGPAWFDAQVQRLVDAGMFALMRRGVSKALIRYALFTGAILSGADFQLFEVMIAKRPWLVLGVAFFMVLYIVWQHRELRIDEDEEAKGMPHQRSAAGMKIWWRGSAIYDGCVLEESIGDPVRLSRLAFIVFMLLVTYTARTPPRPPARKVSAPARLQEARAQ